MYVHSLCLTLTTSAINGSKKITVKKIVVNATLSSTFSGRVFFKRRLSNVMIKSVNSSVILSPMALSVRQVPGIPINAYKTQNRRPWTVLGTMLPYPKTMKNSVKQIPVSFSRRFYSFFVIYRA